MGHLCLLRIVEVDGTGGGAAPEGLLDRGENGLEHHAVVLELDSNDDYVIAYARGEYLLTREGEQIFKLPKIENTEEE